MKSGFNDLHFHFLFKLDIYESETEVLSSVCKKDGKKPDKILYSSFNECLKKYFNDINLSLKLSA